MKNHNSEKKIVMLSLAPMLFDARIQREAKSLFSAGYQVKIIYLEDAVMLDGVPNVIEAQKSYNKEMNGILSYPVFLQSRKWKSLPKVVSHFFQAIELFVRFSYLVINEKANYYHVHDLKPAVFGLIGRWIHRARLIYDAHELEVTTAGERLKSLMRRYEDFTIKRSKLAITVNEEIKEIMESTYGCPVIVIGNRPTLVRNEEIVEIDLKSRFSLPADANILMYIGYVNKIRGIEQTIQAMKMLPENVFFLIMGVGRLKDFKQYLVEFCDNNGLVEIFKRVLFIGPFPPDEIINYLHGADISMMLYQQFDDNSSFNAPNKLYQSIMARTPVLASHNESFPKLVYENGFGNIGETVEPHDYNEIARKILVMLDADNQKKYRANSNKLAPTISWEAESMKLVEAYNLL